jgi:subtilisin family serine protease
MKWMGWVFFLTACQATAADFMVRFKTPELSQKFSSPEAHIVWRSSLVPGLVKISSAQLSPSEFQSRFDVLYAEQDHRVSRHLPKPQKFFDLSAEGQKGISDSGDPYLRRQWALSTPEGIQPDEAWKVTRGNANIKVAVIDTGVLATHPDLQGAVLPGIDVIDSDDNPTDVDGHGTHVAGIIAARANNGIGIAGIASEASIVPIRAVPGDSDEADSHLIQAIEYAVKSGARVINCSFGKAESGQAVGEAILAAGERGVLVVAASGNDGENIDAHPMYPASFKSPNMVVVAASDKDGSLAKFSNFGPLTVDLIAPGNRIVSTVQDGTYSFLSGTSMAAPQVSGIAALIFSANPRLTVASVKQILLGSVRADSRYQGKIRTFGHVDASEAVRQALALTE